MPTIAVERPLIFAALPGVSGEHAEGPLGQRRQSRLLPVLMSVLVVAGVAAIFLYQSGLMGGAAQTPAPKPETTVAAATPPPTPTPSPENSAPVEGDPKPEEAGSPDAVPDAENVPEKAPPDASAGAQPNTPIRPPADAPVRTAAKVPARTAEPMMHAETGPDRPRPISPFPPARPAPWHLQDIWVATKPAGAKVVLDDNPGLSCLSPCQLHGAAGQHRLAVSLPGYLNEVLQIHLEDAALEIPVIVLRQPSGTLMLATSPPGASIRINGELIQRVTPAEISLKPGSYSVTVEKDGTVRTERIELRESPLYLKIPLNR